MDPFAPRAQGVLRARARAPAQGNEMMERLSEKRDETTAAGVSDAAAQRAETLLRAARPHEPSEARKERVRQALRAELVRERALRERPRSLFSAIFSSSAVPLAAAAGAATA